MSLPTNATGYDSFLDNHIHSLMEKYPNGPEAAVVAAAEQLMEDTMKKYDPSHDAFHVNRVRNTALALARAQTPTPDPLVIELAALLHDVFDKKYVTTSDPHVALTPFFEQVRQDVDLISDGRAQLIVRIIDNVSWTTEQKLRAEGKLESWHETCVELHCVQDSDRLDAIGAFGILRVAAYSSAVNRPLHVPPGHAREPESSIAHFHDKLLRIRDRLKTPQGKLLGEKRHQHMLSFLGAVEEEYSVYTPKSA